MVLQGSCRAATSMANMNHGEGGEKALESLRRIFRTLRAGEEVLPSRMKDVVITGLPSSSPFSPSLVASAWRSRCRAYSLTASKSQPPSSASSVLRAWAALVKEQPTFALAGTSLRPPLGSSPRQADSRKRRTERAVPLSGLTSSRRARGA